MSDYATLLGLKHDRTTAPVGGAVGAGNFREKKRAKQEIECGHVDKTTNVRCPYSSTNQCHVTVRFHRNTQSCRVHPV